MMISLYLLTCIEYRQWQSKTQRVRFSISKAHNFRTINKTKLDNAVVKMRQNNHI